MVAERLPSQFGIVIDGWKEVSIHYIAIFANYSDIEGACHYPLLALAIAPQLDETTHTAENHKTFIGGQFDLPGC